MVRGKRSEENGTVLNTMFSVILSSPFCRYIVRLYKMAVEEKILYVLRVCVNCHYRCRKATALRSTVPAIMTYFTYINNYVVAIRVCTSFLWPQTEKST